MEPFLGQLLLASWSLVPKGFASCNGQILPINSNQALFSLLGTAFGGNGSSTFGLPNLQGRTPIGFGGPVVLGQTAGTEGITLNINQVPPHTHQLRATTSGANSIRPGGNLLATTSGTSAALYTAVTAPAPMVGGTVVNFGGNQPHENRQPYLVMNWLIALVGLFPSRN
jgi:microcystin-dependent protein